MSQPLDPGHPLAGAMALVALAAAACALPVSLTLLGLYRRRVVAGMMAAGGGASGGPGRAGPGTPSAGGVGPGPERARWVGAAARPGRAGLEEALRRGVRATAAVYAVAGLCFGVVMGTSWLAAAGGGVSPFTLLLLTWIFAWPVVLSVVLIAAGSWGEAVGPAGAWLGVLIVLGAVAVTRSAELSAGGLLALVLVANGPGTVVLGLFLSRPVRAVGPLVLAFLLVAATGATLALALTASAEGVQRLLATVGAASGVEARWVVVGVLAVGAGALAPVGWVAGRRLGKRYRDKRISDQSVTLDSLWLVFAVAQSTVLVAGSGPPWLLSGALAFAVYKAVGAAGCRLLDRRPPPRGPAPRLLVLRAFSLGRRGERLFTAVTRRWRHVGTVHLIAGPDLATATVEPHEFLDFLHGRLARRFIAGPEALERGLAELDLEPDPDGRFRVHEFFCHDDAWRMVFARLLAVSDAVLMDLRGFSRESAGLAFEVQEVVRCAPLERVVFVVDDGTEEALLEELAGEAWRRRTGSVGRAGAPSLHRVAAERPGDYRRVLGALAAAAGTVAASSPPPGPGAGRARAEGPQQAVDGLRRGATRPGS